ncbi:MAG: hypothetical protein ACREQX_06685, partial [Candidatus Binataceae bacterium]
ATPIVFTSFAEPVLPMAHNQTRNFGFILSAPVQVQRDAAPYVTVSSVAFTQSLSPLQAEPSRANPSSNGAPGKHKQSASSPGSARATPADPS